MATPTDGPVPLRLPAILQNPVSSTARQLDAYKAQQREKAAARRDAAKTEDITGSKRGKRVVRRLNNAAFVDNPHAVAPRKGDYAPTVPLHQRPLAPAFPPDALDRSAHIPSTQPRGDPFGAAPSSHAGAFSTSLKGTRQQLRRGGHRSQVLVPLVEGAIRSWLAGEFGGDGLGWRVIDAAETPFPPSNSASTPAPASTSPPRAGPSRRMPPQHQVRAALPPLPVGNGVVPAVLELSRSPAHVTWAVSESYDRLVVHLVARYYELVSWSEDQTTARGEKVRLTHLVRPALVRARAPHTLLTPETSDVSGHSASGTERATDSEADTETETETVVSDAEADESGDTTFRSLSLSERYSRVSDTESEDEGLSDTLGGLSLSGVGLHRTASHSSSAYASSEGGSEAGLESSFAPSEPALSPVRATFALPAEVPRRLEHGDWSDKPTFFEFVYGA